MWPNTATDEHNKKSQWYALHTRCRYEKKVDHLLKEKEITSYLPLRESYHRWSDRYKKVLTPLFSCYVFVSIMLQDSYTILQTDGAIKLVSFNGKPAVIPDDQIATIKQILEKKMTIYHTDFFVPGKKVKIFRGPLQGVEGTLIQKNNKNRLVISIEGINQALSIEIDYRDLEIL